MGSIEQEGGDGSGDQSQRAQIDGEGPPSHRAPQPRRSRRLESDRMFQFRHPFADEEVADMPCAPIASGHCGNRGRGLREADRLSGDGAFGDAHPPRQRLRDVSVRVAGAEIHPPVHPVGILAQGFLDHTQVLDERAPVERADHAQAPDAVGDGDLVRCLVLSLGAHQLLDGEAVLGQALLHPLERQGQGRPAPLQPPREFGHEGAGHGRSRSRHVRDHENQALRVAFRGLRHLVGPGAGQRTFVESGRDPQPEPAQILDDGKAQHDGDGPQLAEAEGRHALIGGHETAETGSVHPTVAVGDGLQGDVVHPRMSGRGSVRQTRQFAAVVLRQMPAGHPDLFFYEIEVIEQPFAGGGHPSPLRHRRGQRGPYRGQGLFVVVETAEKQILRPAEGHDVGGREDLPLLAHLLRAEEFRAQGRSGGLGEGELSEIP